ncbi:hypothetical protein DPMN_067584 [Dreissena polymorpha]|uniref:Uncharacterized protein n=1 Tax=Dreissena polymorpha TaxID=45954 RepID=A0A9D3YZZ4_DREPO|nr:hypothetical protein DPMN_067584 [Dreissena polymorpha]
MYASFSHPAENTFKTSPFSSSNPSLETVANLPVAVTTAQSLHSFKADQVSLHKTTRTRVILFWSSRLFSFLSYYLVQSQCVDDPDASMYFMRRRRRC